MMTTSPNIIQTSNVNLQIKYSLFGWGNIRCGGILSRPLFAYIILCICSFVQNFSVNGANNAVISTIERVFYLNSVQSGLFLAVYDLATVFSAPLVGYLGSSYSASIFFSLNMIIVAFGNILIASSNFLTRENKFKFNSDLTQNFLTTDNLLFQCSKDNYTNPLCLADEHLMSTPQNAKVLLYVGNFINGIGSVVLSIVGVIYIERIFPKEKAAYCQGIFFAVGTVGGALGIVATGRFLLLYTNLTPKKRLPIWLKPTHPLWIGCWWLPYLVYGGLCFLLGIFVSGLPNYEIPDKKKKKLTIPPEQNNSLTVQEDNPVGEIIDNSLSESRDVDLKKLDLSFSNNHTTTGIINPAFTTDTIENQLPINNSIPSPTIPTKEKHESWREMLSVTFKLLKNVRFVFVVIVSLFEGILIKGFVPFVSKYFEYQHQLDTSSATLITGAIALLSVIVGCPLGAFFMNKYSWTPMRCAKICAIIFTISSFLFLFLIFSCSELKFQQSTCSSKNTHCCENIYHPVCYLNNSQKMFLSPCHFGCTNQTTSADNSTVYYSSCDCEDNIILTESACQFRRIPCVVIFVLTLTGAAFVVFLTAFIQVPLLQVLLYSVPLSYQNMALALRQTIVRVLGQTTGPLLFGFVFDLTCLVWLTDCYHRRTCKVYNNRRMGLSMALSGFLTRFISGIACGIVYLNWKYRHSDESSTSSIQKNDNIETTHL